LFYAEQYITNTPLELKTLRSSNIDKAKSFQEEQLGYYIPVSTVNCERKIFKDLSLFSQLLLNKKDEHTAITMPSISNNPKELWCYYRSRS
jgi:hypothetical protein